MTAVSLSVSEIAENAKELGAIRLDHLIKVMAEDESYIEVLPELWRAYNLDEAASKMPRNEYPEANLKAMTTRAGAWYWLLTRFTGTYEQEDFYFKGLPKRKLLPMFDLRDGEFIKLEGERREDHYIKLNDLKEFLEHIEWRHKISMPLPWRLFSDTHCRPGTQTEAEGLIGQLEGTERERNSEEEGKRRDSRLKASQFRPYHQTVVNLVADAVPEIESLYEHIRDEVGWLDCERDGERKESALRWFEISRPRRIEKSHLENSVIFALYGRHSKRDAIGTFCKELISSCLPERLPNAYSPKKAYGIKPVYENLYCKIKEKLTRR